MILLYCIMACIHFVLVFPFASLYKEPNRSNELDFNSCENNFILDILSINASSNLYNAPPFSLKEIIVVK